MPYDFARPRRRWRQRPSRGEFQRSRAEIERERRVSRRTSTAPEEEPSPPFTARQALYHLNSDESQQTVCVMLTLFRVFEAATLFFACTNRGSLRDESEGKISDSQIYNLTEATFFTAGVGCFFGGILMYKFPRRGVLGLASIGHLIAWIYMGEYPNMYWMVACRILSGLCIGISSTTCRYYMYEIIYKKHIPIVENIMRLSEALGFFIMAVLGAFFHWSQAAWICAMTSAVTVLAVFYMPESPEYLWKRRRTKEAMAVHLFLAGGCQDVADKEFEEMKARVPTPTPRISRGRQRGNKYTCSVTPVFITMFLYVSQQLTGIYGYLCFMPKIMQDIDGSIDPAYNTIVAAFLYFSGNYIFLVNQIDIHRMYLVRASSIFISLSSFALGILLYLEKSYFSHYLIYESLAYISIIILLLSYSYGWAMIPHLVNRESVPYAWKDDTTFIMSSLKWLFAALVVQRFNATTMCWNCVTFSILSMASFLIADGIMIETYGKLGDNLYFPKTPRGDAPNYILYTL